jgi:hypothetical protein
MPTPRLTGHRLRSGTHASGSITSTYNVTSFPIQTDQGVVDWVIDGRQTTSPEYARIVVTADGTARADGFQTFQWHITYMTHDMMNYWNTQFLGSSVKSAAVSVLTYDAEDTAVYLNCTLYRAVIASGGSLVQAAPQMSSAEYAFGGYQNVIWRFAFGVTAA